MNALELIAAERERQVNEEGWTYQHDDGHTNRELAIAGACYAIAGDMREAYKDDTPPPFWPWSLDFWKPTPDDELRELVKAGALIVAEIERLQRAQR